MARRSGLGRGLGALIPPAKVTAPATGEEGDARLLELPVSSIRPNPNQPRKGFDEEALASLTASVRELGVLQPVLVRPAGDGQYELVAGERRWRAARRAGLQTIPAVVRPTGEVGSLEQALVENIHRQDLNPLEEAAAYQQLLEDFGLTQEQVGARVGKSKAAVSNTLRLFQLPPSIQKLVAEGSLSAGHARALLGTPDRAFQEALARRAVTEQMAVRAVEDAVRSRVELEARTTGEPTAKGAGRPRKLRAPGVLELEELLSGFLETRVKVEIGPSKGRVTVEFADLADLERIYRRMTEPAPPTP